MSRRGQAVRVVSDRAFVDEHADEIDFYDTLSPEEEEEVEARLRYLHLPPRTRVEVDLLLRGHVDCTQLPRLPPRTVRLFISSTCTDFAHEKEALIKDTFIELRAYCRQSYGIDLQVIDPRWGQDEGSDAYHSNLELYSTELCRSTSNYHGPHQLVLLGDKLGVAELPRRIPIPLYNVAVSLLEDLQKDVSLLQKWYREDLNALPDGEYVLEPIHEVLGDKWDERDWLQNQRTMRQLLMEAAEMSLMRGEINTEEVQQICGGPVLAQEIQDSLTSFQTKMLAVCREFSDLSDNSGSPSAPLFTDLITSSNHMDPELAHQRQLLKQELDEYLADDGLLMESSIRWSEPLGLSPSEPGHVEHIGRVCRFVYEKAKQMIDDSVAEYHDFVADPLYEENLRHWTKAADLTASVYGRDDVLSRMEEYITSKTSTPLVVSGPCGQGKSTAMAAGVQSVITWLEKEGHVLNVSILTRFCGYTERSSDVRPLIEDICRQVSYCTGSTVHRLPKEYKNQQRHLRDLLQSGNFRGLLVLFIDGLDELEPTEAVARLDWLPFSIPNNVKIVLSSSTDNRPEILTSLRRRYPQEGAFYSLGALSIEEATSLFVDRLKQRERRLTGGQLAGIIDVLRHTGSPLDIEAMAVLAAQMASYDDRDVPGTTNECLSRMLDDAERKHRPLFVAHTLAYLTLADGLSEAELYDILSLDDEVLEHLDLTDCSIRRFPVVYWIRLFGDINDFFGVRQRDSVDIVCWRHSVFKSVAMQRYCAQSAKNTYFYTVLADYYKGRGSYVANPTVPRCQSAHRTKVRQLPLQPNVFQERPRTSQKKDAAESTYNKRRQRQLPKCLLMSNQKSELNKDVLFNFHWIHAKLKAQSVYAVLQDYEVVNDCWESRLVYNALRLSEVALKEDPDQLSTQLLARLLQFYQKHENIRKLLYEADLSGSKLCSLVPIWQCYHSPGAVLVYCHRVDLDEYNSQSGSNNVKLHTISLEAVDRFYLLCKKASSSTVYTWDIPNGVESRTYKTTKGKAIYPSPCGLFINCFTEHGTLQVYDANSSQMTYEVCFDKPGMLPSHVAVSSRYTAFVLPGVPGPYVMDITAGAELKRLTYQCGPLVFSANGRLLALHSRRTIIILETPLMVKKCSVDIQAVPSKLLFTEDHSKIYTLTGEREVKMIQMNYTYKQGTAVDLLSSNVDIHDIILSHANDKLLATALYSLDILDLSADNVRRIHITEMPAGEFDDRMKPFTCSGFSADDAYVVATRGKYVCVWDNTGRPIKLLTYAASTISAMFLSKYKNILLTLHENKAIQMWNLENLGQEMEFNNRTHNGNILMATNAPHGARFICVPSDASAAVVYNCATNEIECRLQHGCGAEILSVAVSPGDRLAVTVSHNSDKPDFVDEAWCMVRDTKLWHLETGRCLYGVTNNVHTVFSPDGARVVFCPCLEYDLSQPTLKVFNLVIVSVDQEQVHARFVELNEGVLLEAPIFLAGGRYLCFVLCDGSRKTHLCLYSLDGRWSGVRFLDPDDMLPTQNHGFGSEIIGLRNVHDDQLLVVVGCQIERLEFDGRGCLDLSRPMAKLAVLYDVYSGTKRIVEDFLTPSFRFDLASYDPGAAVFALDGELWCGKTGRLWKTLDASLDLAEGRCCMLMGRRYLAVVTQSGSSVVVYRTSDMERQTKIQIHGQVRRISTALDDRTIAVACLDARICLFTLTLTECDAMTHVINKLPSRRHSPVQSQASKPCSRINIADVSSVSWREMMTHKKESEFEKLSQRDVINGNGIGAFLS